MQVVEKDEGEKMKNILLFIIVFLTCYQYSYAENEKYFLYKDYYFGMPLEEARKINNATPCKDIDSDDYIDFLCFKNEQFSNSIFDAKLSFINKKLYDVELKNKINILKTFGESLSLISKKMPLCSYVDEHIYIDILAFKENLKETIKSIFDMSDRAKTSTFIFFEQKHFKRGNDGKISAKNNTDILNDYPDYERIVLLTKNQNNICITFGTKINYFYILEYYNKIQNQRDF